MIACLFFHNEYSRSITLFERLGILEHQDCYKRETFMFEYKFEFNLLPVYGMHLLQRKPRGGHSHVREEPAFVMSSFRTLSRYH